MGMGLTVYLLIATAASAAVATRLRDCTGEQLADLIFDDIVAAERNGSILEIGPGDARRYGCANDESEMQTVVGLIQMTPEFVSMPVENKKYAKTLVWTGEPIDVKYIRSTWLNFIDEGLETGNETRVVTVKQQLLFALPVIVAVMLVGILGWIGCHRREKEMRKEVDVKQKLVQDEQCVKAPASLLNYGPILNMKTKMLSQ